MTRQLVISLGQTTRRRTATGMVVLATVLLTSGCSNPVQELAGSPRDLLEVPESHPAVQILDTGATDYESFVEAAERMEDLQFQCTRGGRSPRWQLCLVSDRGILAVVGFDEQHGMAARIVDTGLNEDVLVPLDHGRPVAVRNTGPQAVVDIENRTGDVIGGMSVPWTPE